MKILLLSHAFFPAIGGIETVSEMLANEFVGYGHEVHILTWTFNDKPDIFPYTIIRKPSFADIKKQIKWCDLIFENNPCLRLSWPNIFFGKPIVTALHTLITGIDGKIKFLHTLKIAWIKKSTALIACSNFLNKSIGDIATVIGNPYDNNLFVNLMLDREKDFVFLGRLVSDKGADLAIKAFKLFTEKHNNSSLTIIGEGSERTKLEKLAKDYFLTNNIQFLGKLWPKDIVPVLNKHKFLLVPSVWDEPFGLVALEGMSCGCIPIASDGGGLPDAVANAGLLFKKGNISELNAAMQKLYQNKALQKQLMGNAIAHLEKYKSINSAKQYLKVFESAIMAKAK